MLLTLLHRIRCFQQRDVCRAVQPGQTARCAQNIRHQRSAPRAQFQQMKICRRTLIHPCLRKTEAQKLSKHLRNFGGSDEIALNAKGRVFDVVSMFRMQQTDLHKIRNTHWTIQRNTFTYDAIQRRHADTGLLRMIRNRPINIIGIDNSCPMVNPHSPNWMT